MKNYLITIFNSTDDEEFFHKLTPAEMQAHLEKYSAFSQKLSDEGRLIGADGLSLKGATMKKQNNDLAIIDGPHIFAKEMVGGFYYFRAQSLDEAKSIAATCPALDYGATVEVREQMDYGQ